MRGQMNQHLHHRTLRYPRTLDEAFRTPRYASAIEKPMPSFWQRVFQAIKELL